MAGAFHCIDVDPLDHEKTAFATPFGSFQQKRLGFGVTNEPATYCRHVDQVLKDIPDSVAISFLDDGIIHSAEVKDQIRIFRTVLTTYQNAGLKLAGKKWYFFADEITYLATSSTRKTSAQLTRTWTPSRSGPFAAIRRTLGPSSASRGTTASTSPTMSGSPSLGRMPSARQTKRRSAGC